MAKFSSFSEILSKVREIVTDQFCIDASQELDNNAYFIRDLGADSLDVVELVMVLEQQFEIQISDEYTTKIHTVQEAAELIAKMLEVPIV